MVVPGIEAGEEEVGDRVSDVERQLSPFYLLCSRADTTHLCLLTERDSLLDISFVTTETPTCLIPMQEA